MMTTQTKDQTNLKANLKSLCLGDIDFQTSNNNISVRKFFPFSHSYNKNRYVTSQRKMELFVLDIPSITGHLTVASFRPI